MTTDEQMIQLLLDKTYSGDTGWLEDVNSPGTYNSILKVNNVSYSIASTITSDALVITISNGTGAVSIPKSNPKFNELYLKVKDNSIQYREFTVETLVRNFK